jgi:uncharacterized protein YneF (UPF0154 family)
MDDFKGGRGGGSGGRPSGGMTTRYGSTGTDSTSSDNSSTDLIIKIIIIVCCIVAGALFIYAISQIAIKYQDYKNNNPNGTFPEFIKNMLLSMFSSNKE